MAAAPNITIGPRYQVLIADDEPIIREGIRDAIDWEALGMEVVDVKRRTARKRWNWLSGWVSILFW